MRILGIETSCDDTCVSVAETAGRKNGFPVFRVLSNIVSSQEEIHRKWGGIYPSLARREHQKNLVPVLERALGKSKLLKKEIDHAKKRGLEKVMSREPLLYENLLGFLGRYQKPDIGSIAVTVGPGLDPSLWTGINFAKALSFYWEIPLIPINHIEAHLLISFFSSDKGALLKAEYPRRSFLPATALIVSGGHTQILLIRDVGDYTLLGETRDDAAGECFDKTARILGLGYPGGPAISAEAEKSGGLSEIKLPRPMMHSKDFDFSFSGLKTAVLYLHKSASSKKKRSGKYRSAMAREIQDAIIEVLLEKTMAATEKGRAKAIVLGGGVVANKELQKRFKKTGIKVLFPPKGAQTDNALMIAVSGFFKKPVPLNKVRSIANLKL